MTHLFELLSESARKYQDQIFCQIREGENWRVLTFRQLRDSALALACWLKARGYSKGDKIALLSENRPEWGIAFFGILRLGGVVVPLEKLLKPDELESILAAAKPRLIITSANHLQTVKDLRVKVPILCLDNVDSRVENLCKVIEEGCGDVLLDAEVGSENEPAVIVFTSGTVGKSKGVMLSHRNFLSNVDSFYKIFPSHFFKENFLSILPLNHAYELTGGFLAPLMGGGRITYLQALKPALLLQTLRETKTKIMLAVPAVLEMLQRALLQQISRSTGQLKKFNFALRLSSLIPWLSFRRRLFKEIHSAFGEELLYFVSGGAPLSAGLQDFFEKIGFKVIQGYGLTEAAPVLTVNPLRRPRKNSVGKPVPGVKIKISPGGEILVAGPNVMLGYYENPEATREVMDQEYFSTGDLGYLDHSGYLYISGRVKNLIVSSTGKKILPEEVEEKLKGLSYVKELCVLGCHEGTEEHVTAVVVLDQDKLTAEEVSASEARRKIWEEIKEVNRKMADFKRVEDLILWEGEFPKTTTMKIKRVELEKLIRERGFSRLQK